MWRLRILRRLGNFNDAALTTLKKFDKFDISKYNMSSLTAEYGLDSLDTVEFVIALEEELKVQLTDEEALAINTVDQALATFSKYKPLQ